MSESLRDQLLRSGLVKTPNKTEVKRKPSPKRSAQTGKSRPSQAGKQGEPDLAKAYALRARVEQRERDHARADAERVARERKERKRRLQQLLQGKALNVDAAEIPRHFPHRNKIRRVYCTQEQLGALNGGVLSVVHWAGHYLLVPRETGLGARDIDPDSLVLLCDPDAQDSDDVPDDLVW